MQGGGEDWDELREGYGGVVVCVVVVGWCGEEERELAEDWVAEDLARAALRERLVAVDSSFDFVLRIFWCRCS